ncbi:MAG: hypothetical protein WDZ83_13020 [Rhizobiaceae bacterium]
MVDNMSHSDRAGIISAVSTPLGLLVLSGLLAEAIIALTVIPLPESEKLIAVYIAAGIMILIILLTMVAAFARPEALYGKRMVNYGHLAESIADDIFRGLDPYLEQESRPEAWQATVSLLSTPRDEEDVDSTKIRQKLTSSFLRRASILKEEVQAPVDLD